MLNIQQMLNELFLQPLLILAKIPGQIHLEVKMGNNLSIWGISLASTTCTTEDSKRSKSPP